MLGVCWATSGARALREPGVYLMHKSITTVIENPFAGEIGSVYCSWSTFQLDFRIWNLYESLINKGYLRHLHICQSEKLTGLEKSAENHRKYSKEFIDQKAEKWCKNNKIHRKMACHPNFLFGHFIDFQFLILNSHSHTDRAELCMYVCTMLLAFMCYHSLQSEYINLYNINLSQISQYFW